MLIFIPLPLHFLDKEAVLRLLPDSLVYWGEDILKKPLILYATGYPSKGCTSQTSCSVLLDVLL